MQINGSFLPAHVARAYGLKPAASPEQAAAVKAAREAARAAQAKGPEGVSSVKPAQEASPVRGAEALGTIGASASPTGATTGAHRLVSGVVPGGVDFSADQPRPSAPSLPFYRHPADANAAATGVHVGRALDASG